MVGLIVPRTGVDEVEVVELDSFGVLDAAVAEACTAPDRILALRYPDGGRALNEESMKEKRIASQTERVEGRKGLFCIEIFLALTYEILCPLNVIRFFVHACFCPAIQ